MLYAVYAEYEGNVTYNIYTTYLMYKKDFLGVRMCI